jgi:GMP synthase (glutamine-hydrolysing)
MSARRPFLILATGTAIEPVRRRLGDFPHWFRVAMRLPRQAVRVVDAREARALPEPSDFAGIVVTGSGAMVTDREPWSEAAADWLGQAARAGHPVLGVCYGHQLLAHALGGRVDWNPRGREMGTVRIEALPAAAADPLLAPNGAGFAAQVTHLQSVLEPPADATVLARSAQDDCHAFRIGDAAWGVQFHPEFSTAAMRAYIAARADAIRSEGDCPRRLQRGVSAAPAARAVLRRFVGRCRRR